MPGVMDQQRRLLLGAVALAATGCKPGGADAASKSERPPKVGTPYVMASRYQPSFADEFSNPDLSRFSEEGRTALADAPAWRSRYRHPRKDIINQEKQVYVDAAYAGTGTQALGINPFSIADSVLTIRAERLPVDLRETLHGQLYSSGCITTERSFAQQYGYFEMRARVPLGKGLWPSFWMMPLRDAWPPEIDVFEASGSRPGKMHFAARDPGDKKGVSSDWVSVGRPADGWQTYACEWTADAIRFIVDGKLQFSVNGHKVHEPMYLLANLALGSHDGGWIPDPGLPTWLRS